MSVVLEYLPLLLRGLGMTLLITVLGGILTIIVAFTAGLARLSSHAWVRIPAGVFVEVFRGTSMLVQLFWFFFALPFFGIQLAPLTAAVLVLGLNEGAYASEVVRGAIKSLPKGQTEAAIACGMPAGKRMRRILIPQAVPIMLPPMGNVMVDLLKNTSLVSLITVLDLTFAAQQVRTSTGESLTVFGVILVVYFLLSMLISALTAMLERRFSLDRRDIPKVRLLDVLGRNRTVAP
ncbi:ectoine/hydroxyectoine ABC transporter permease subunit EhuC [Naumannella cuiyingiana]|uniref:Polar amino acid transport system permease protein n=1 Tax=Naumannella cuiyingiana TaxID=1347891 RepID=A0A7Z0D7R2_9ACTN|nr:ectoine/hydroxyectoine ABC transporter permease subunit EhuC [Naumannella cuiyingiana]NYI70422.1 polar amino acid transport system permease protein [Naumannella cuiyingiana]